MVCEKLPVSNWNSIVHMSVRSQDGERVGNVVAVLANTIHVETAKTGGQYVIPKENVAGFDGAEVKLDTPLGDMGKFVETAWAGSHF